MIVGYLRSFFLHFCNIINDQDHNQQRYEAEQQRAEYERHVWGKAAAGVSSSPPASTALHQPSGGFSIYKSKIRSVISAFVLIAGVGHSQASCGPSPLSDDDCRVCVCVSVFPNGATLLNVSTASSIPQSNFESVHPQSLPWEQQDVDHMQS